MPCAPAKSERVSRSRNWATPPDAPMISAILVCCGVNELVSATFAAAMWLWSLPRKASCASGVAKHASIALAAGEVLGSLAQDPARRSGRRCPARSRTEVPEGREGEEVDVSRSSAGTCWDANVPRKYIAALLLAHVCGAFLPGPAERVGLGSRAAASPTSRRRPGPWDRSTSPCRPSGRRGTGSRSCAC